MSSLLLAGCEKYQARPLMPSDVVMNVERSRRLLDAERTAGESPESIVKEEPQKVPFTFMRAAELMRSHSPALKELQAEYATALALSRVKTPFPNPALEVGPQFGFGPDAGNVNCVQPFGSLGFSIPTGRRLKRLDELHQMQAVLARVESEVKHRELYLELRKLYSQWVLGHARVALRQQLAESGQKSIGLTRKLIEVGMATSLDVGLIELEDARLRTETYAAEVQVADVAAELSQLIGVHAEHFTPLPEAALPRFPAVPGLKDLQQTLVNNHPGLARLRARYEVAERELHLEIAKQYPDFKIGPSYDGETGEKKSVLGLTLGIELPVFDRNQQAVATAKLRREEIRMKYEAAANRALALLDRAWRAFELSTGKLNILNTVVKPKAAANIELARKSMEAGAIDSLRFLETERSQRAVMLDAIETEIALYAAWIEMEQAIGYPLVLFPAEDSAQVPMLGVSADETVPQSNERDEK